MQSFYLGSALSADFFFLCTLNSFYNSFQCISSLYLRVKVFYFGWNCDSFFHLCFFSPLSKIPIFRWFFQLLSLMKIFNILIAKVKTEFIVLCLIVFQTNFLFYRSFEMIFVSTFHQYNIIRPLWMIWNTLSLKWTN